jgi:hypothetical protein
MCPISHFVEPMRIWEWIQVTKALLMRFVLHLYFNGVCDSKT